MADVPSPTNSFNQSIRQVLRFLKPVIRVVKNRYVFVILLALIWMLFFDDYDLRSQLKLSNRIEQLSNDIKFYEKEIEKVKRERHLLQNDRASLERFARERYLMKKPNEDLYVIVQPKN